MISFIITSAQLSLGYVKQLVTKDVRFLLFQLNQTIKVPNPLMMGLFEIVQRMFPVRAEHNFSFLIITVELTINSVMVTFFINSKAV